MGRRSKGKRGTPETNDNESIEDTLRQCEAALKAKETDWDEIYFELRLSPLSTDFTPEKFLRTPVSQIKWIIDKTQRYEQNKANIASASTAQLANLLINVAHAFSGSKSKGPSTKAQDFLPFPKLEQEMEYADNKRPTTETKRVLAKLVQSNRIPPLICQLLSEGAPYEE